VLVTGMIEEESRNISAGVDVIGLCGSAAGYIKELEVESLRRELKSGEKHQGEKNFSKHSSFLSKKRLQN
jgi:hypothetical protein